MTNYMLLLKSNLLNVVSRDYSAFLIENTMELNEFNKKIDLFEMANVRPNKTGLNMLIFISPGTQYKHGPRIKVSTKYGDKLSGDNDFFIVTLDGEIIRDAGEIKNKDLKKIKEFVSLNKDVLKKLWDDEVDPYDAISSFKKVS